MWLFGKLCGSSDVIGAKIGYLRCFTLAFDFLGVWYLWKWLDKRMDFLLLLLFLTLNISWSYNTVIWGQVDGIVTTMVFIAIYYAQKNRIVASSIWMILALNMKLQAVIFVPVWGLLCLQAMIQERNWKKIWTALVSVVVLQLLLLLPFLTVQGGASRVWQVVTTSMGRYPFLSMNAFNGWFWISAQPGSIEDTGRFIGSVSYRQAGLGLFFLFSFISLLPLLFSVIRNARKENTRAGKGMIALTCALICLLFFFFNTQMHERYCHPAFIFLAAYSLYSRRSFVFWLFALAYFLNMEGVLQFLKLPNYHTLIFHPAFVAGLFFILIVTCFALLRKESLAVIRKI
jgi:Gpi18-like mannosyltransferase